MSGPVGGVVSGGATAAGSANRVLVAGVAGGVGTTTVTALLFNAWMGRAGAPLLADHTAGTLGHRLAEGDEAGRLDADTVLIDAGARAFALGPELSGDAHLVIVAAATPVGCAVAGRCLTALGADVAPRTVLVLAGSQGRYRVGRAARRLATEHPQLLGVVVLPTDLALTAGGRIPLARLGRRTLAAVAEVADLVSGVPTGPRVRVSA